MSVPNDLSNEDFKYGTHRITASGTYHLTEDIIFDPDYTPGNMSWSKIPADSTQYPQNGGYFLGFFAALTVEADDVVIDCQGYSMSMSASFHKSQRFFSLVELASSPFILEQGPPLFGNPQKTNATLVSANNVTIQHCNFGLTSHHTIHGNDNNDVTLKHLTMRDFEVAGISLNGASRVSIEYIDIGPSLEQTFGAKLSQVVLMDHVLNTLMLEDAEVNGIASSTSVTIRGETFTARQLFNTLRNVTQEYLENTTGPLVSIIGSGTALPDGSAIYGLLLHRRGVAINDFGASLCPDDSNAGIAKQRVKDVDLKHINIHDLKLNVDQVAASTYANTKIKGVQGDLFPITEIWNESNCFEYVGNPLADAQVAAGVLRDALNAAGVDAPTVKCYMGSAYIPTIIQSWASGNLTCSETGDLVQSFWHGNKKTFFSCDGDTMDHLNKGAVGVRLEFQENIHIVNMTVANISNEGIENAAPYCSLDSYQGLDVRPVTSAHVKNMSGCEFFQDGTFHSTGGDNHIFPMLVQTMMRDDDLNNPHGRSQSMRNALTRTNRRCEMINGNNN